MSLWALVIALTQGSNPALQDVQEWTIQRIVAVGGVDNPEVTFHAVQSIAVDRNGQAYVAEASEGEIRVFAPSGKVVRTIGRTGEGPGEFRVAYALTFAGDTLVVADHTLARSTWIDPTGRVVRTSRLVLEMGTRFRFGALLGDGSFAALPVVNVVTSRRGVPGYPLLRVAHNGTVRDTLSWLRFEQGGRGERIRIGDSNVGFPEPFAGKGFVAGGSNARGLVVVDAPIPKTQGSATFGVHRIDGFGRTVYERSYSFVPEPINDAAIAEAAHGVASLLRLLPTPVAQVADLEDHIARGIWKPDFLPPVTDVTLTDAGEVWLRREANSIREARWDVLGPDGIMIARARGPAALKRLFEGNGILWGIEVDSLGVERVARYQIVR